MPERTPRGFVVSPHYLATNAGHEALVAGGNAVDAIVATAVTLSVVAPYYCGFGGDCFALVHDGEPHGYMGAGRAPAAADLETMLDATGGTRPFIGGLSVTVPGAVQAWFDLLERFGTRSFDELATRAIEHARFGFMLSGAGAERIRTSLDLYPGMADLHGAFGYQRQGDWLRQPRTAALIELLAAHGPDAFYRGEVSDSIAAAVATHGGLLAADDLAAHTGRWVHPIAVPYRDVEVLELPPPTQGIAALEALRMLDDVQMPAGSARTHRMIEATKLALTDRDAYVGDDETMTFDALELLTDAWIRTRRRSIDPNRVGTPGPTTPQPSDTAYLAAVDGHGMWVSLIQSNFLPFGSGVRVQEWGITLQSRGSSFQLDADHPNAWGSRKLPMHTLAPAMLRRDGEVVGVLGTMGGDAQTQVHTQLITALIDDRRDARGAIAEPRWRVDPGTWTVHVEHGFDSGLIEDLRALGHDVVVDAASAADRMGHAGIIQATPTGWVGASDPRSEGLALGG